MNASISQSQIATQPEPSAAVARFLKRPPRLFIGGEWVEAKSQERISVVDPATGREIASVVDANSADVDRAPERRRIGFVDESHAIRAYLSAATAKEPSS